MSRNFHDSSIWEQNFKGFLFYVIVFVVVSVFALGIINSLDLKSIKEFSGLSPVKRIDELSGEVVHSKRSGNWDNLFAEKNNSHLENKNAIINSPKLNFNHQKIVKNKIAKKETKKELMDKSVSYPLNAIIKEDLELTASTVYNASQNIDLTKDQGISGSLTTNDGIISSLSINLPNGKSLSVSTQEEMMGSVFQYFDDESGETYSGMMYKIGRDSYMVTLTNHPGFEGTRIQFDGPGAVTTPKNTVVNTGFNNGVNNGANNGANNGVNGGAQPPQNIITNESKSPASEAYQQMNNEQDGYQYENNDQSFNEQPVYNQPADNQPADNQPADNQPAYNQPIENQLVDNQPVSEPATVPMNQEVNDMNNPDNYQNIVNDEINPE